MRAENAKLIRRVAVLTATVALLLSVLRVSHFRLDQNHVDDENAKSDLVSAVERARAVLPLRSVLGVLRLSSSRYGAWKHGEQVCSFDDVALYGAVRQMRCTSGLRMKSRISLLVPEFKLGLRGSSPIAQGLAMTAWQRPMHDRSAPGRCPRSRLRDYVRQGRRRFQWLIASSSSLTSSNVGPSSLLASITKLGIWSVERKMSVASNTLHLILVIGSSASRLLDVR